MYSSGLVMLLLQGNGKRCPICRGECFTNMWLCEYNKELHVPHGLRHDDLPV